jgi:hypothetical protein
MNDRTTAGILHGSTASHPVAPIYAACVIDGVAYARATVCRGVRPRVNTALKELCTFSQTETWFEKSKNRKGSAASPSPILRAAGRIAAGAIDLSTPKLMAVDARIQTLTATEAQIAVSVQRTVAH